jgi:uncharacterized protein involved in exopolysaccharide biosynthesis
MVSDGELTDWTRLVRRRWPWGVAVFGFLFVLVATWFLTARPVYRAEARLRLGEPPPATGVSPGGGFFGFLRLGGDPFANDLEVIASRSLAERVVLDAGLNARVVAPKGWHRDSLFVEFGITPDTDRGTFAVVWGRDDTVSVEMVAPEDAVMGSVAPGHAISFGGMRVAFRPWRPGMPREIRIVTVPYRAAVQRSRSRIAVKRPRREANVVEISFDDPDPGIARAAVASTVDGFVTLRTALQRRESNITTDSLRGVATQTLADLTRAEAALSRFQRDTRLVAPREQSATAVERYAALVTELATVDAELATVAELLARADSVPAGSTTWTMLVSHPRFLQNPTIGEVLTQLMVLEQKRTELAGRRTETSRELQVVLQQIDALDRMLRSLIEGYRDGLIEQRRPVAAQVATIESQLAELPDKTVELGRRQLDVRVLTEVVALTEQRLRQEELREALTFANVQVIDPPALRFRPVWPRKRLGLAIGFMLASLGALVGMIVRDRTDRAVRTGSDVRRAIAAPVLAIAVRRHDGLEVAAGEAAALHHMPGGGPARTDGRVAIVTVDEESLAREVAAAMDGSPEAPTVSPGRRIDSFGKAVAASAGGAPMVFAVESGRTARRTLERAADLVRQAGGTVAGAIVVVRSQRQASSLWE